jgi:hypothetical protein
MSTQEQARPRFRPTASSKNGDGPPPAEQPEFTSRRDHQTPGEPFTFSSEEEAISWTAALLVADLGKTKLIGLEADQWARSQLATRGLELPGLVDLNDLEDVDATYLITGYLELVECRR